MRGNDIENQQPQRSRCFRLVHFFVDDPDSLQHRFLAGLVARCEEGRGWVRSGGFRGGDLVGLKSMDAPNSHKNSTSPHAIPGNAILGQLELDLLLQ